MICYIVLCFPMLFHPGDPAKPPFANLGTCCPLPVVGFEWESVTIAPEPQSNCITFNSSFCQGLPYKQAVFPTAFAPESEAADLLASAIHSRLSNCGEAAKVVLCYHFFQPCVGTSERLCAEICQDVKLNCNSYMEELLTFFSPAQAQQFLSACNDLPSEESNPSCIKNLKKQPDRISSKKVNFIKPVLA